MHPARPPGQLSLELGNWMQGTIEIHGLKTAARSASAISLRWERQRRTRIFSSTALTGAANPGDNDDTRLFLLGSQLGGCEQAQTARAETGEQGMGTTEQQVHRVLRVWRSCACSSSLATQLETWWAGVWLLAVPWCFPVAMGLVGAP